MAPPSTTGGCRAEEPWVLEEVSRVRYCITSWSLQAPITSHDLIRGDAHCTLLIRCRLMQDELLRSAVYKHGGKKWKTIATFFAKRSPAQCNARWNELQNQGTAVKKPWSPAEDLQMLELVKSHGAGKWAVIASYLPGRNGKQCRERCVPFGSHNVCVVV